MTRILIVDSGFETRDLLEDVLEANYTVCDRKTTFSHIEQAGLPDLVLINAPVPTEEDFNCCKHLKALPEADWLPVIFLLGTEVEADIQRAFAAGAADCVMQPFYVSLLRQRIIQQLEMVKVRRALRRSEERYDAFARLPGEYFYDLTVTEGGQMRLEAATPGLYNITGYSPREMEIDAWRKLVHPEDRGRAEARFEALLQGKFDVGEFRIITKSGAVRWLRDYVFPVWDEAQTRVTRVYGVGRDVTQTKATEDALQESRQTLELALEASEVGIWDWNLLTDRMHFSANWLPLLGYDPTDIPPTGAAWFSLICPEDVIEVRVALQRHFDEGAVYELEHRLTTADGSLRWVLTRGRVVEFNEVGEPLRMVGTYRDIQRAKTIQEALAKSEERHRIISETISDYAYSYIVKPDGTLKKDWSTQAFHDITGFTFEEVDKDGWQHLIHPDDRPLAMERFQRLLSGEKDVTEFRIVTKSGEIRWLRDHGHPVMDERTGRVVHIYGAAQDITHRRHFEDELQRHARELQERNEELDAFAYTVAHDLKNPISSMMGFASLIQSYYDRMPDDQILEYLDLIMEGGYKLKSIINALLLLAGVSKIEEAEFEPLDMREIVEDSKKRLAALIQETQAKIVIPEAWPTATGYGPWVEEVWTNYISNALKYGGTPPYVEVGAQEDGDMVRFWVRDNGEGLTPEEQQRIFAPFTRLNKISTEGHGLGLAVVQRIVHKLGGDVAVESQPGVGSVFSFTLPA